MPAIPDFPIHFPAPGQVTLAGRLAARYAGNLRYLSEIYRQRRDWMLEPFQHRDRPWVLAPLRSGKAELNWAGEYAGKWLDAACLAGAAGAGGDAALAAQARAFAPALAATQEPDGYLGIELPPRRANCDWDVWNIKYSLTGLLTHHEVYGDPASLLAARRGAEWLISRYAPITSADSAFYHSPSEGGVSVDIIDQLVRVYRASGDLRLLDFVSSIVANFPPLAAMRASGQAVLTHAYMLSSYLGGVVEWAAAAGRLRDELPWLERVWEDLAARHLYPTGSLGFREHLRETAPNDTPVAGGQPDRHHQETCATVEWLLFNARLYQATGRARYAQALEHSAYNALLAAQSVDGQRWLYYLPLRYEKTWFSGPTSCCYWSGPRGIARLPGWVYALDAAGLRVNLYEASSATLELAGQPVRVEQTTDYPDSGRVLLALHPAQPVRFTLRLRRPHCSSAITVALNGQPLSPAVDPDGYLAIDRTWAAGDRLTLEFDLPARLQPFLADDYAVLLRGPEVLALDQRDNPGLDLDQVALPSSLELQPSAPLAGRRRYAGLVRVIGQPASVLFTPYADCGGDGARFRTAFPRAGQPA